MSKLAGNRRLVAWLRLLRPPNLPTVPGDPLAGFLLAGGRPGWRAAAVMLAVLLVYAAGLIWNDVADVEIDRRERPERPLPSGAVAVGSARIVAALLAAAGLAAAGLAGAAALAAACLLTGMVLVYDFAGVRGRAAGVLIMGGCRAVSVVLGIAAASSFRAVPAAAWAVAAGFGAYVAAVSLLAKDETRLTRLGWKRHLPSVMAAVALLAPVALASPGARRDLSLLCALPAFWFVRRTARLAGPGPAPGVLGCAVGRYIRALLLMQAACCALAPAGGGQAAGALLLLFPLASLAARSFHGS